MRDLPSRYVLNLSSSPLTPLQTSLLSKGLKFAPCNITTPNYDPGIHRLSRNVRLRYYFQDAGETEPPPFRRKSSWMPPPAPAEVEHYLGSLHSKFEGLAQTTVANNLSRDSRTALNQLIRCDHLIIRSADKGSCVVVRDRKDYIADGLRHLSNTDIYEEVPGDYTGDLVRELNRVTTSAKNKGYLTADMAQYLTRTPEETRTQQLYFLPKIHKDPMEVRPIVSGVEGPTERISSFLDHFLQPLVSTTPSFTRDSTDIINFLESIVLPADITMATIDVSALYLSIPHEEGIDAVIEALFTTNHNVASIPFSRDFVRTALNAILKHNVFEFNSKTYKQVRGTAMGTKVAPAYANVFMSRLEEDFFSHRGSRPLVWRRFIDDILCLWDGPRGDLDAMLGDLNAFHSTIKFTWNVSSTSVDFLDLKIHKGSRFEATGTLDISTMFKATNKFQYLAYSSSHPRHVFRGVLKGELLRALRTNSDNESFDRVKRKLSRHFRQRGYPRNLVADIASQVRFEHRHAALQRRPAQSATPLALVCDYHPQIRHRDLRTALDPPPQTIDRPVICYRRNGNIADKVVRARLSNTTPPPQISRRIALTTTITWKLASAPCGLRNCHCCRSMSKRETVYAMDRIHSFKTPLNTTCSTSKAIYLMECRQCTSHHMYVGQTKRPLRERIAGHRAAYSNRKNMPVYHHFRRRGHSFEDARFTVLEVVAAESSLATREQHWMYALSTIIPSGLNSKFSVSQPNSG